MDANAPKKLADELREPVQYAAVLAQIDRIVAGAPRRARLLKYLLDRTIAGEGDKLNEYSIGVDVFDKSQSFDPRIDSIVRTNVARLRRHIREYYAAGGNGNLVLIDIAPGSYLVSVQFRETDAAPAPEEVPVIESPLAVTAEARSTNGRKRAWLTLGAIVGVVIVVATLAAWRRSHSAPAIHSIVVLPFRDDSSNHQSGYLADGLTDEITNDLTRLSGLRVIARTTAFEFRNKGIDNREIGRQFNVDASLSGSLGREGDRLRIRAQLSRNSDGYQLWSRAYDVRLSDVIDVQKNIARSIADDLQLSSSLGADAAAGVERHDPTPEAHELYLRGAEAWNAATDESFRKGAEFFQAAVEKDPRFAQAWLGLANTHWNIGVYGGWKGISATQVESEAQRALDLDPGLASAHATLGQIIWRHEFDWPRAEAEFRTALKYGAGTYNVHNLYADYLAERGQFEECHRQFRIAQELSPLQDALFTNEAAIYIAEDKPAEAEREIQSVLARKPGFGIALVRMATIRLIERDCDGAAGYVAQVEKLSPGSRISSILNWSGLICSGKLAEAKQIMKSAAPLLSRIDLAAAHANLGDTDQALDLLDESFKQGDIGITAIGIRADFMPLRSNTRFIALEKRIGLTPE